MSIFTGVNEDNQPTNDIISGYVGEIKTFGFSGVPAHCLACDGSEVSRVTYKELFEVFGETYGAGDGETTFNLPDFRGYFLRGAGGAAAAIGTAQGDAIRNIIGSSMVRPLNSSVYIWGDLHGALLYQLGAGDNMASTLIESVSAQKQTDIWSFDASRVVPTAAENRPVNYAVNFCVVYE